MSDNKMKAGEFCWNELMTFDTKKAKEFYTSLLGWSSQDHQLGPMTYTMFSNGGEKGAGGMMQIPADKKGMVPPHWMSYIGVDNLDATIKKAQSLGGKVTVPTTTVPDMGRFVIIQDPTGAHIAFWEPMNK